MPCRVMRQIRWIVENDGTVRHNGIGEAIDIRIVRREPIEHCRGVVRWQQSDLPAAERRGKADREAIAVPAKIDHMAAPRQPCRERGDIAEVALGGDWAAGPPGEHRTGPRRTKQRMLDHRPTLSIVTDRHCPDLAETSDHIGQTLRWMCRMTPLSVNVFRAQHGADQRQIAQIDEQRPCIERCEQQQYE